MFDDKVILVTGGTGSFGRKFIERVLATHKPRKIIVLSRDEFKQFEMAKRFPESQYPIRYFLGDIRDRDRLMRAFRGVDTVVHAAALKQVPALEYNPFEAVKTNILGAQNIVDAAIESGVRRVVALSTDKAVSPANLYGATKLSMEKLMVAANVYAVHGVTRFSIVRYGNVIGSRGSVVPFFMELYEKGVRELPITDPRMTRFWITLDQGVDLVLLACRESVGGEIFIPKLPSLRVTDIVPAIGKGDCREKVIGIRPGEKLHESLISEDEARSTVDAGDYYVITPQFGFEAHSDKYDKMKKLPEGFFYRSDRNDHWMKPDELREAIKNLKVE